MDAFSHRELGCQPFVTMVKATDLLDGDHLGPILRLDGARVRTVLLQGKMGPRPMVVPPQTSIHAENTGVSRRAARQMNFPAPP